ncbi:MAG: pantetheine-phosphate adenylyltransferase, partial [Acidimicrobiia bacterium]|nr:pantetheine-phosphate adenylyltransferase [Acidimicrobiia bacterium]
MTVAVVPGSFDPPTLGHVDVISRAVEVFDRVLIAVVANPSKTPLFSSAERIEMLTDICADWPNAEVDAFDGLLVEFARDRGAVVIVKGLRAVADFEYELQMAQMNQELWPEIETIFLVPEARFSFISSSLVREVAKLGGDVASFVAPPVLE